MLIHGGTCLFHNASLIRLLADIHFQNHGWLFQLSLLCVYKFRHAYNVFTVCYCCFAVDALWLTYMYTHWQSQHTRTHMPNARVGNCFSFVGQLIVASCRPVFWPRVRVRVCSSKSSTCACAYTALRRAARVHARVLLCLAKPLVWVSVANEY